MCVFCSGREEVHHPRRLERDPVLGEGEVQLLHEALLVTRLQAQVHTPHGQAQAELSVRPAQEMSLEICFNG